MRFYTIFLILLLNLPCQSQTYSIDGKILYSKGIIGNLRFQDSCYVTLVRNNTIIAIDTIGTDGYYHFTNLSPGEYSLRTTSNKMWVGGGNTDALIIMRHFIGMKPLLTGISLMAGDPSNNGVLNAADALYISSRFCQIISAFPGPDYIFETYVVNIVNTSVQQNVKGCCNGDVNRSGWPLNTIWD